MRVFFRAGNIRELPKRLERFASKISDWRGFFTEDFLPQYLSDVQYNFDTEGGLVGGWRPLSQAYATWKAKRFPGRRILERTLRLRRSLSPGAASETIVKLSPRQMVIQSDVEYAGFVNARRRFLLREGDLSNLYPTLARRWVELQKAQSRL